MDEVDRLIHLFKEENTDELESVDSSNKPNIIAELENIEDERILPFFLDVLSGEREYDLARIEILRILEIRDCVNEEEYQKIGQTVKRVLENEPDDEVRNYAAMAISNYIEIEGAVEEVGKILVNEQEEINLRWNAFAAVEKMGAEDKSVAILRKLVHDPEFGESALRVLNEWEVK